MLYKNRIAELRNEYIGKKIEYAGKIYTVVNVDYNGIIHINKPAQFTETTAIYDTTEAKKTSYLRNR